MMIGRKWPLASEEKGFWKRPTTKSPNVAAPEFPAIARAPSRYRLAVSPAARIDGFRAKAIATPKIVAKREVTKYQAMTLPPTRPDLRRGRLAAPRMREKKMIG